MEVSDLPCLIVVARRRLLLPLSVCSRAGQRVTKQWEVVENIATPFQAHSLAQVQVEKSKKVEVTEPKVCSMAACAGTCPAEPWPGQLLKAEPEDTSTAFGSAS